MSNKASAAELLASNPYCVLSTCKDNAPWITPLLYAYDNHWNLYWISAIKSRHSEYLVENPRAVAIVYNQPDYGQKASALYIEGRVEVCETPEAVQAALVSYQERTESGFSHKPDDYLQESPCRFYRLTPETAQTLGESQWDENLLIDRRVFISLP